MGGASGTSPAPGGALAAPGQGGRFRTPVDKIDFSG